MHVLLTNDDGIRSKGIDCLYNILKEFADVTIVAPANQKSSVSHAITLSSAISFKKIKWKNNSNAYSVKGTPADCVKLALGVIIRKKPDLIISGINHGDNDGLSVHYSGTVAAAREGALSGIPSIAVSLATFSKPQFHYANQFISEFIKTAYMHRRSFPKGSFLNINIPHKHQNHVKGLKYTRQGTIPIHTKFTKKSISGKQKFWMSGKKPEKRSNLKIDTFALNKDYITVTPIKCDMTDDVFLKIIQKW